MSGFCHAAWQQQKLIIPKSGKFDGSEHVGPGENWFRSLHDSSVLNNYTRGIMNLYNDPAGKYLMTDSSNFYKLKAFKSKMYKLTFKLNKKPA